MNRSVVAHGNVSALCSLSLVTLSPDTMYHSVIMTKKLRRHETQLAERTTDNYRCLP